MPSAGTKYGIPFPIYCRASFGILGANVPAFFGRWSRAAGLAFRRGSGVKRSTRFLPSTCQPWKEPAPIAGLGVKPGQLVCFMAFWAVNMIVIWMGINSIRLLLNIKAPLLIVLGLACWPGHITRPTASGRCWSSPPGLIRDRTRAGEFWTFFFPALTGMIGFWATLSLNIPDFSRYAEVSRDQALGQAFGLPPTMALYSFIGVAVTSATVTIYGKAIWDPVVLLSQFRDPFVLAIGMVSLCLATLATNIAANVVGPANDFSHLWPRRISFRTGGLITGVLGIVIQPWKLIADPTGYIFLWLVAYSSLLGAVGGILIADYYALRRMQLDLKGLYQSDGPYWYVRGFNPLAMIALAVGIAPCVPGFLGTIGVAKVQPFWISLYHYAWFISFGTLGGVLRLADASRRANERARKKLIRRRFFGGKCKENRRNDGGATGGSRTMAAMRVAVPSCLWRHLSLKWRRV